MRQIVTAVGTWQTNCSFHGGQERHKERKNACVSYPHSSSSFIPSRPLAYGAVSLTFQENVPPCISQLPRWCDKISDRNNLREEGLILNSQFHELSDSRSKAAMANGLAHGNRSPEPLLSHSGRSAARDQIGAQLCPSRPPYPQQPMLPRRPHVPKFL